MNLDRDTLLTVVKPFYGVPEAGNHWFNTYHKLHKEKLKMSPSTYDHCLLYKYNPDCALIGITGMQTDDTFMSVTEEFAAIEQKAITDASIVSKPVHVLTTQNPLMFNDAVLKRYENNSISVI